MVTQKHFLVDVFFMTAKKGFEKVFGGALLCRQGTPRCERTDLVDGIGMKIIPDKSLPFSYPALILLIILSYFLVTFTDIF